MSGGTLICLAANEIVMSSHAVLGPVDPQLDKFPAASLLKVVEQKPIEKIDDETLVFADVGKKAIEQVKTAVQELLQDRMPQERADELAHKLSEGTWPHDYPISAGEAKSFGLNVSTDIPAEILDLLTSSPSMIIWPESGLRSRAKCLRSTVWQLLPWLCGPSGRQPCWRPLSPSTSASGPNLTTNSGAPDFPGTAARCHHDSRLYIRAAAE